MAWWPRHEHDKHPSSQARGRHRRLPHADAASRAPRKSCADNRGRGRRAWAASETPATQLSVQDSCTQPCHPWKGQTVQHPLCEGTATEGTCPAAQAPALPQLGAQPATAPCPTLPTCSSSFSLRLSRSRTSTSYTARRMRCSRSNLYEARSGLRNSGSARVR